MPGLRKLRKQISEERCVERQLELDIWGWERDKLIAFAVELAYRVGIYRTLNLPLGNFCSFLEALADQYVPSNTYHNFTHATDVLLVVCHLILGCGASSQMTDLEIAACFLAAHAHDVGHPGTNNSYQVVANTPLGAKYGANATLEAYSADLGQELLEQYRVLSNISPQDRSLILSIFRSSILATDMAQHQTTTMALRRLPNDFYIQNYPPKRAGKSQLQANGDFTHSLSLPALLLHAADISGPARQNVTIWLTRSVAVTREFVYQGDCERANHIPVTEAFDRVLLKSEGLDGFHRRENEFTKGLVLPYFRDVERVWNGIKPLRIAIEENLRRLDQLDKKFVSRMWTAIFV